MSSCDLDLLTFSGGWIQGRFVGFGRTPPLRPGVVVENAGTAWLYQSSSVRDIFTEIVPQLYATWHGNTNISNRSIRQATDV